MLFTQALKVDIENIAVGVKVKRMERRRAKGIGGLRRDMGYEARDAAGRVERTDFSADELHATTRGGRLPREKTRFYIVGKIALCERLAAPRSRDFNK
jgi:hypothetical protein